MEDVDYPSECTPNSNSFEILLPLTRPTMRLCSAQPLRRWTSQQPHVQMFLRLHFAERVPPNLFAMREQKVRLSVEVKGVLRLG